MSVRFFQSINENGNLGSREEMLNYFNRNISEHKKSPEEICTNVKEKIEIIF